MQHTKKAARNSGNYSTPKTSMSRDAQIIPRDTAQTIACLLLAFSFGAMFLIGAWFGW